MNYKVLFVFAQFMDDLNLLRLIDEGTGDEIGVTAIHGGIVLPIDGASDGDVAAGRRIAATDAWAGAKSSCSDGASADGDVAAG